MADIRKSNEENEDINDMIETQGSLAAVPLSEFVAAIQFLTDEGLLTECCGFLEGAGHSEIVIGVPVINSMKRFLLHKRLVDKRAKKIVMAGCGCNGPGGGGGGGGGGVSVAAAAANPEGGFALAIRHFAVPSLSVATCNRKRLNLQSRVFFNRHYLQLTDPKTDISCNRTCNQPAQTYNHRRQTDIICN